MIAGVCRVCGCTQKEGCIIDAGGQVVEIDEADTLPPGSTICSWVEPDLCSACVESPAPPPLLVDLHGRPLRGAP
jgi:hypothetical protein